MYTINYSLLSYINSVDLKASRKQVTITIPIIQVLKINIKLERKTKTCKRLVFITVNNGVDLIFLPTIIYKSIFQIFGQAWNLFLTKGEYIDNNVALLCKLPQPVYYLAYY